jgi:hypothetical protein
MTIHQTIPLSGLLCLAAIFDLSGPVARSQSLFDGFNAYCTSNKDYTGSCTNVETSKDYSCTLIPGSLIIV